MYYFFFPTVQSRSDAFFIPLNVPLTIIGRSKVAIPHSVELRFWIGWKKLKKKHRTQVLTKSTIHLNKYLWKKEHVKSGIVRKSTWLLLLFCDRMLVRTDRAGGEERVKVLILVISHFNVLFMLCCGYDYCFKSMHEAKTHGNRNGDSENVCQRLSIWFEENLREDGLTHQWMEWLGFSSFVYLYGQISFLTRTIVYKNSWT